MEIKKIQIIREKQKHFFYKYANTIPSFFGQITSLYQVNKQSKRNLTHHLK